MPSGTGVIGPSGVFTGSFSVGRKHVPSDNYRDKTSTLYNTEHKSRPLFDISSKNMVLWQHYFRTSKKGGFFHVKPGHESKQEFKRSLFDLKLLNNLLSAILM